MTEKADNNQSVRKLQRNIRALKKDGEKLTEIVEPTRFVTRWTKGMVTAVTPHLPSFLGDLIEERVTKTPMAMLEASYRDNLHSLYETMGPILEESQNRIIRHEQAEEIVEIVENPTHPDRPAAVESMYTIFKEQAEEDLAIEKDAATEALLKHILEPKTEADRVLQDERALRRVKEFLSFNEPTILALRKSVIGIAGAYEEGVNTFSYIRELRTALDLLNHGTADLGEASRLKIAAFNTIVGQIEVAVRAAELASDAVLLNQNFRQDSRQLQSISKRARLLNAGSGVDIILPEKHGD